VDEEIGERLRHGERITRAFSPWGGIWLLDPGRWPGLGLRRAFGAGADKRCYACQLAAVMVGRRVSIELV
jgi:hypothetical protein